MTASPLSAWRVTVAAVPESSLPPFRAQWQLSGWLLLHIMGPKVNDKFSPLVYQHDSREGGQLGEGMFSGHSSWRQAACSPPDGKPPEIWSLPRHLAGLRALFTASVFSLHGASTGPSETVFYFPQLPCFPSSKLPLTTFMFKFLKATSYFPCRRFGCLSEASFQRVLYS